MIQSILRRIKKPKPTNPKQKEEIGHLIRTLLKPSPRMIKKRHEQIESLRQKYNGDLTKIKLDHLEETLKQAEIEYQNTLKRESGSGDKSIAVIIKAKKDLDSLRVDVRLLRQLHER